MRYPKLFRFFPFLALALSSAMVFRTDFFVELLGAVPGGEFARWWHHLALTMVWLTGAALFNQLSRWLVWDKVVAHAIGGPVPAVLKELSSVLVYLVTLTLIVGLVFEESVTAFLAALGAGGIVLGLGLRDLFADVFTGLAINIDRSFIIGDWVQINEGVSGVSVGQINEIGWRCTSLTTEAKTNIVVPNGVLGQERMINISRPSLSTRYETSLTVEFSVSPDRVKRVLLAAVRALEDIKGFDSSKAPVVLISDTDSLGIEYLLRYWILPWAPLSPTTAKDLVLDSVLKHLHTAGIGLAYPKTDIYTSRMPARQFDSHSPKDLLALLADTELFRPLGSRDLEEIVGAMERHKVPAGQALFHQGDKGKSLFILIEGLLEVCVEKEGRSERVARILPGECLGEMSLLTGEHRSATISAVTESVVYEVDKKPMTSILARQPALLDTLSQTLARRQVSNELILHDHDPIGKANEVASFARQIVSRMRDFLDLRRNAEKVG